MIRSHTFVVLALAAMVGCHSGTPAVGSSSTPPSTVDDPAREADTAAEAERREYSAPSLRALDKRPIVGPPPRIEIIQPKNQALVARGPVMLKLQVTRWKLATAPGNHVHVKIDDSNEFAIRDVSKPIAIDERYERRDRSAAERRIARHSSLLEPSEPRGREGALRVRQHGLSLSLQNQGLVVRRRAGRC